MDEEVQDSDKEATGDETAAEVVDAGGPMECRVTPWYFRRMGLMTLMLAGMATYFIYDGVIGYPKKNRKVDIYDAFLAAKEEDSTWEAVVTDLELETGDPEEADHVAKVKDAYEASAEGEPWAGYSRRHKLPEKPERKSDHDIEEQFHYAWGLYGIAGVVVVITLLNARKKVRADDEAFYTTKGTRVPFASIYRVDKRKWDNKGLAYAFYKDEGERKQKAVIDDLKFAGADKILNRVLAGFDGELVERLYIDDDEDEEDEEEAMEDGGEDASGESDAAEEAGKGGADH